jgi:hypothetical protein
MAAAAFLCARAAAPALLPHSRRLPRRLLASRAAAAASGEGALVPSRSRAPADPLSLLRHTRVTVFIRLRLAVVCRWCGSGVPGEGGVPGARDHGRAHGVQPHQRGVISQSPSPFSEIASLGLTSCILHGSVSMQPHLRHCSCDVTVWNRTRSKCDPLLSLGAKYVFDSYCIPLVLRDIAIAISEMVQTKFPSMN